MTAIIAVVITIALILLALSLVVLVLESRKLQADVEAVEQSLIQDRYEYWIN